MARLRVIEVESNRAARITEVLGLRRWVVSRTQLLLDGDRVLVVMSSAERRVQRDNSCAAAAAEAQLPKEAGWSLSTSPASLALSATLDLDGTSSTRVRSTRSHALSCGPGRGWRWTIHPVRPSRVLEDSALAANREVLAQSTIEDWLPRYGLSEGGDRSEGSLVDCADVSHPRTYSGTSMLTVLTLDLTAALRPDNSVAVVADGQTVYGTGSSVYIADDHTGFPMPVDMRAGLFRDVEPTTEIHKFDITGGGKAQYVASGSVDGRLLNQYSLSEHEGYLRVATTLDQWSGVTAPDPVPQSESRVTVLSQRGDGLQVVGSVGGLGQGEQIYAVRFIGPLGYVVTFRQVDPLYTLDLSDPRSPRVVGELKVPGYSSYLHPLDADRLIGIGQDADAQGMVRGTQVSLFDVGDPAAPARLDTFPMPGGWSDAEHDPHAFLYWPDEQLVVIPVWWDGGIWPEAAPNDAQPSIAPAGGAVVLRIDGDSLVEVGALSHGGSGAESGDYSADPTIRRSLVIGDTLWTLSASGALASDLDDLDQQAWVPFIA